MPVLDTVALLLTMARQSSFWFIHADGVDKVKFRVQMCPDQVEQYMCKGLCAKGLPITFP